MPRPVKKVDTNDKEKAREGKAQRQSRAILWRRGEPAL